MMMVNHIGRCLVPNRTLPRDLRLAEVAMEAQLQHTAQMITQMTAMKNYTDDGLDYLFAALDLSSTLVMAFSNGHEDLRDVLHGLAVGKEGDRPIDNDYASDGVDPGLLMYITEEYTNAQ